MIATASNGLNRFKQLVGASAASARPDLTRLTVPRCFLWVLVSPRANLAVLESRSDFMMVAVGFSPPWRAAGSVRRGATLEKGSKKRSSINRRSATAGLVTFHRGLKPTATFVESLRDAKAPSVEFPTFTSFNPFNPLR